MNLSLTQGSTLCPVNCPASSESYSTTVSSSTSVMSHRCEDIFPLTFTEQIKPHIFYFWMGKGKDFTKRKDCFRTSLMLRGIGRHEALWELLLCLHFAPFSISFLSCRAQATLGWQMASIWSATLSPLLVFTAMKQGEQAGSWSVLSPSYCYDC